MARTPPPTATGRPTRHRATFGEARISDSARVRVARELDAFTDEELQTWFSNARFPEYYPGTDDEKDLNAWVGAYRGRVNQMRSAGPCPQ